MNTEPIPDGAYLVTATCKKCGQKFETHTEANMSDPEVAALVERFMGLVLCQTCKSKLDGQNQHFKPPWERERPLV